MTTTTTAAETLEALTGHLGRYAGRPGSLATHLEASHHIYNAPGEEAQERMHQQAHQAALTEARAELDSAQDTADCSICPPGACPGPHCPGSLAT